ncbi:hypothetical protein EV426DRAFT_713669 [Tirmania nivea]|nr:hypothetical protein EV426DRAFT_713669 [Tirmania nivea]
MKAARSLGTTKGTCSIKPQEDFLPEHPETQGLLQPYGLHSTQGQVRTGAWYHAEAGNHAQRKSLLQAPRHEPGPGMLDQQETEIIPGDGLETPVQSYGYPSPSGYYSSDTLAGTSPDPYNNYGYGHDYNIYHAYLNDDRPTRLDNGLPFYYQTSRGPSYCPSQFQLTGNVRPMTSAQHQLANPFTHEAQPTFHSVIGQARATTLVVRSGVSSQKPENMRLIDYEGQFSDPWYADLYEDDDDSGSILMADIPGFPMPPSTIPNPFFNISPPPSVPCPPLPSAYSLVSRHLGPAQTSEVANQKAIPRSTTSNVCISSLRFLREEEVGFSGLEAATEGIQSSNPNAAIRASTTCSDPFDFDQEYTHNSVSNTPARVAAEHRSEVISALPDTSTLNSMHRIVPEPDGVHHCYDSFIGQGEVEGSPSGNMAPSRNLDLTRRRTLNGVSDRGSTNDQSIAFLTNIPLDSDSRATAPSVLSTVEDDFGRYKGLAEAAEKLTNTFQRPDERLSHLVAASQYRRVATRAIPYDKDVAVHMPYALTERKAYLGQRHKARLARALEPVPALNSEMDEIELGAMSRSLGNHHQGLAWGKPRRNTALQRLVAAVIDRVMDRSCAWFLLGFWAVLIIAVAVPLLLIGYPSGIQRALNEKTEFSLSHLTIMEPSLNSFGLNLDITVDNQGRLTGELEPMAADLSTMKLKVNRTSSDNQTANSSRSNAAFLKRRASELLRRASLTVADEARVYLQKLDMPSIEFSDDQRTRIVEAPTSYVNRTNEWGDLLAKVFSQRERVAIEFDGEGVFKKGAMRMKMHLKKSISLLQFPLDEKARRIRNRIVDWNLQYDKETEVVRLSGQSHFANPANITMYLGDCAFDLVHRNVVVGVLRVSDYLLVPGVNDAIKFNAELNVTVLEADQELLGSFLSTLMIWDPTWLREGQEKYTFQVWGKSASINGTEIPWITKAVQGINDTVYVLSNSDNGTTDISYLASDFTLRDMQIDFSNLEANNRFLTTRMLGGRLALNLRYPVAYSEFTMDMMTTTHVLEFVSKESNTYARLEVTDSDRTTSWKNDFTTADGRVRSEKHLSVDLKNATWTILDSEAFANNMLRPLMNDRSRRVVIKGMVVMMLRTPLGDCTIDPILYAKSISIDGMSIINHNSEKAAPDLVINNVALTGGYPSGVNKYPHLQMTYDLQVRNFGDGKFRFGDIVFNMMHGEEIIGKTKMNDFTISRNLNVFHGVSELEPYHPVDGDTYFHSPVLNNMIAGRDMRITLSGTPEPLGVTLGTLVSPNLRGFPSVIMGPARVILDSMELTVNANLRPIAISLAVMNPFHTGIAVTFFEGNITARNFSASADHVQPDRRLATIARHDIAYREIASNNGVLTSKTSLPKIAVDPLSMSYWTKEDIPNPSLEVAVQAYLRLKIGSFNALVPYFTEGRKEAFTPNRSGGGVFKLVFVGGVTVGIV